MGDLGLENVGNVGVPKKRDNPNGIRPVKIPNWTASPAAIAQPRRRKPRWDVIRVCRTEPRRGANPQPRDPAVSPPVHHSHDLHRVTGGRNAARRRQKVSVGNECPTITRQQTGRPKAEKFPPKCYSQIVTETPRPWDRRSTETTKAYAAFLAYIALGARRSVREALRQNSGETAVSGKLRTWEGWSSKNAWVSRANARDEWIARTSDDQIIINILACKLALVTRAHDFLTSTDSAVFLRGARAFTLQHPPVQQVEDVTRIEDLPDLSDADLGRMRAIRDEARQKNGVTPPS